jgi:hypothetical protein
MGLVTKKNDAQLIEWRTGVGVKSWYCKKFKKLISPLFIVIDRLKVIN